MASQALLDNGPGIVDKIFKTAVAGAQGRYKTHLDIRTAKDILFGILKTWDGAPEHFHEVKSAQLDAYLYPGEPRSPYTSFVVRYFKLLKESSSKRAAPKVVAEPVRLADWYEYEKSAEWSVWVCERTREIHLFHNSTMSRTESLYTQNGFDLGSVIVEGEPSRHKRLKEIHRKKCFEVTYRILSGK
jgi:hypothetical protein